jgi:hypothetical protein
MFVEFNIEPINPNTGAYLFNKTTEYVTKDLPSEFVELTKRFIGEPPLLAATNFDVFSCFFGARKFLLTIKPTLNMPAYHVERDIKNIISPNSIYNEFLKLIKGFDKKLNDEHLNKCVEHQLLFQILWFCFIKSLYGSDFGHTFYNLIDSVNKFANGLQKNELLNDFGFSNN